MASDFKAPTIAVAAGRVRVRAMFTGLSKSSFVKNVLVVMSGSAIAQIIGYALSPVVSRLFTPTDFGVFGAFMAVSGVVTSFVTLDYSQAIMLPKSREEAAQVFVLACLITVLVTLLCAVACVAFPQAFLGALNTRREWFLIILVISVLVGGLNSSFQAWCVRVKAFKATSTSQVVRGCCSNSAQIMFGWLKTGAGGLAISSVVGDLVSSLTLVRIFWSDLRAAIASARWEQLKRLAWDYRDFPMYSASQNLLNSLSVGLPVLLLTSFYGVVVAGAYSFGMRLLNAPLSLVLAGLRQVLFQRAGEIQHQGGQLFPLFVKTTFGLFGLALLPMVVLGLTAPRLFPLLFGSQWEMAGRFASCLVTWLLFAFCNLPAVLFARLIRIQRVVFFYNVVLLIARVVALIIGGAYLSPINCILALSLVGAALNFFLILLVAHALVKKERGSGLMQIAWSHWVHRSSS